MGGWGDGRGSTNAPSKLYLEQVGSKLIRRAMREGNQERKRQLETRFKKKTRQLRFVPGFRALLLPSAAPQLLLALRQPPILVTLVVLLFMPLMVLPLLILGTCL